MVRSAITPGCIFPALPQGLTHRTASATQQSADTSCCGWPQTCRQSAHRPRCSQDKRGLHEGRGQLVCAAVSTHTPAARWICRTVKLKFTASRQRTCCLHQGHPCPLLMLISARRPCQVLLITSGPSCSTVNRPYHSKGCRMAVLKCRAACSIAVPSCPLVALPCCC